MRRNDNRDIPLYHAWVAADTAWSAELAAAFGKRAGDMRYRAEGKGEPGTALRATHDAYVQARDAYYGSSEPAVIRALLIPKSAEVPNA